MRRRLAAGAAAEGWPAAAGARNSGADDAGDADERERGGVRKASQRVRRLMSWATRAGISLMVSWAAAASRGRGGRGARGAAATRAAALAAALAPGATEAGGRTAGKTGAAAAGGGAGRGGGGGGTATRTRRERGQLSATCAVDWQTPHGRAASASQSDARWSGWPQRAQEGGAAAEGQRARRWPAAPQCEQAAARLCLGSSRRTWARGTSKRRARWKSAKRAPGGTENLQLC